MGAPIIGARATLGATACQCALPTMPHARCTEPTPHLSVILITHNESRNVLACLRSVAFADEWIVVDSGSTDDTREIALSFGAHVVKTDDWPGFGAQKNRALALARGRWVLSIDADERVSEELAAQINAAIRAADGTACNDFGGERRAAAR